MYDYLIEKGLTSSQRTLKTRWVGARHTSHVTRHTSHVTRHTSHVTRHTSHVTRHTSLSSIPNLITQGRLPKPQGFVQGKGSGNWVRLLHVTRHTSHVTLHTSHFTLHTSHVTRHTPHVTRHTSHVTRHTSHATEPICRPAATRTCSRSRLPPVPFRIPPKAALVLRKIFSCSR